MIEPIRMVCRNNGYGFTCDEKELRKLAGTDDLDDRVRLAFWDEYHQASSQEGRMRVKGFVNVNSIFMEDFITRYLRTPGYKLVYILRAPVRYGFMMRALLNRSVERLAELVNLPFTDEKTGKVNTALISQVLKAYQLIDLRVKGAIVQKMQIQQQNLNYDVTAQQAQEASLVQELSSMSMTELEVLEKKLQKVEQLEAKMMDPVVSEIVDADIIEEPNFG
jgi:hypothetical protein